MYGHQFIDGGIYRDEETHEIIDVEYLRGCFAEMAELLQFIQNVENRMITISMTEYSALPPVVTHTWMIYKAKVNEKQRKEIEKMKAHNGTR